MASQDPDTHVRALTDGLSKKINLLLGDVGQLQDSTEKKQGNLDALENTMDCTGRAVLELESMVESLVAEQTAADRELSSLDESHRQLLEQQAKLDEVGHELFQRVSRQDQYLEKIKEADQQQEIEVTRARFLRDEMRDEFYKKEEELKIAQNRLDDQNMEFFKQFEELKADVRRQRKVAAPLLEDLDNCEKATVTRITHFMKSDTISALDLEKSQKLKKFLEYISKYRKVFDEVGDLEFEVRNSERALEFNQSQVRAKLTRMESLEKELVDLQGMFTERAGCYLRNTPRRVDLTISHEMVPDVTTDWSDDGDMQEEIPHEGGMGLHRCVKVTDIHLKLEEEKEEEAEEKEHIVTEEKQEDGQEVKGEQEQVIDENMSDQHNTDHAEMKTETDQVVKIDMVKALLEKEEVVRTKDSEGTSKKNAGPVMEGTSATEKHISSIQHRGDLALSRDSKSSFVKPTHRTELRATGSSAMYSSSSGRKQKK